MAERVEALVLQMSVDLRALQKSMDKAKKTTADGLGDVEGRFSKTSKKVKEEAGKISSAFEEMARGVPIVGDALANLGPAGAIAGAGLGVLAGAFKLIYDDANKAREKIDDLATSAENVAVSAESFQAFKALGIELDVAFEQIEGGLNKLQIGAAEAATGTGALYNGLKKIKPELIDTIVQAKTQEDRWDALSAAITGTEDQLTKVAIAKAAFGKTGAQFVRLLDGEDKTVRALTTRYRELGVILSEDLVKAVGAADQRLQLTQARLDANATRAAAAWIPATEALSNAWLDLNLAITGVFDSFASQENKPITALQKQIDDLGESIARYERSANSPFYAGTKIAAGAEAQLRKLKADRALIEMQLAIKQQPIFKGPESSLDVTDPDAAAAAEAKRVADLARLQAETNRLRQSAAQYLNELGDSTQLVKIKEAELNSIVQAGFLTRAQAATALENYRLGLVKLTDAQKDAAAQEKIWIQLLENAKTPVEKAQDALTQFWDAVQFGTIGPGERAAEILAILTKNLQDAGNAARQASPELQAVARAREAIAGAKLASMSRADRLAAERGRLNGLVGNGDFSQGEADSAFKIFSDADAAEVREGMRDSVKAGIREGLVSDDWGEQVRAILADGVVNGLEDAINRLADSLTDIVLGKQGGDGGLLGAAAKFVFGGARANGGGVNANKSYLVGERGPEILRMGPGQNGQVLNASQVNGLTVGGGGGGAAYVDARISIGGVDMATWSMVKQALEAQAHAIAARIPGAVNTTLSSNRRQKRRF